MVAGRDVLIRLAAVANGSAAAIHFVVTPAHLTPSLVLGAGFLVAAWAQLAVAMWLLRGTGRPPHVASLAVNTVIATAWLLSRTVGLPVGGGAAEAVALSDATATGLELLAVVLAVTTLARPKRRRRLSGIAAAGVTTVATVVVVAIASAATIAGAMGGHGHLGDTGDGAHAEGVPNQHGGASRNDGGTASGDPPPDYWRSRLRAYRAQRGITGPSPRDEDEAFRQLLDHLGIVPPTQGPADPPASTAHDDGHTH